MKATWQSILKNQKGYTLIELMVVLTVLGIVIGTIGQFFVTQVKSYNTQTDILTVQDEGEKASSAFRDNLLDSASVASITRDASHHMTELILNQPSNTPNTSTLQVDMAAHTLILVQTPSTNNKVLATNIEAVDVWPLQPTLVGTPTDSDFTNGKTLGLRVVLNMKANTTLKSYTQEIYFRNHP